MKYGIISDAHGNWKAFEACIQNMGEVDSIIYCGDTLGYYFEPQKILQYLRENKAKAVLGNHDIKFLAGKDDPERYGPSFEMAKETIQEQEIQWLSSLKETIEFADPDSNKEILICHGSPWRNNEYIFPNTNIEKFLECSSDIVIMGHAHYPFIRRIGSKILINPGSCGQPRDGNTKPSYAILNLTLYSENITLHRIDHDTKFIEEQCNTYAPNNDLLKKYL